MKKHIMILMILTVTYIDATASPYLDIWNYSFNIDKGQETQVIDGSEYDSSMYIPDFPPRDLRIYGWGPLHPGNPNDKLMRVGINPNKTYVLEFFLEAQTVPSGVDNVIDLNYWVSIGQGDPLQRNERNFFMRQDPCSPSPYRDTSIYDLIDLTNYFTENAQINLPNIYESIPRTPSPYDKWNVIICNYADLFPSVIDGNVPDGKVNLRDFAKFSSNWQRIDCNEGNHWCNFADLDRDGIVDYNDLGKFSGEWLYDTNDPNTW